MASCPVVALLELKFVQFRVLVNSILVTANT